MGYPGLLHDLIGGVAGLDRVIHRQWPAGVRADPDIMVTLTPPNKPAAVLLKHVPHGLAVVVHEWGLRGADPDA